LSSFEKIVTVEFASELVAPAANQPSVRCRFL
jgi:hypothetical protein